MFTKLYLYNTAAFYYPNISHENTVGILGEQYSVDLKYIKYI